MNATLSLILLTTIVMTAGQSPERPKKESKQRRHTAPDGSLNVVVLPVSKKPGQAAYESRIEFKSTDGKIACVLDYSSGDNEHGFGVVKAEWTPDSQFFVFSLTSSGGHQAWHAPTEFLSRKDGTIRSLDDYFESAKISNGEFRLNAPNTIKTEIWKGKAIPIVVKLAALPSVSSWKKSHPLSLDCAGGQVFKPEQP